MTARCAGSTLDELYDLDDPEQVSLEPLSELQTSGDAWEWVGRTGRELEDWTPLLTTRLRSKLHPVEVAHFERRPYLRALITHASRRMSWQPIGGWTAEDVAADALEAVVPLGFDVGGASWIKLTRRVMNRKVADLLRAQDVRESTVVPDYPHDKSESPEFVAQVLPDDLRQLVFETCTWNEAMSVLGTYVMDWSGDEVAQFLGVSYDAARKLIERGRSKVRDELMSQFSDQNDKHSDRVLHVLPTHPATV